MDNMNAGTSMSEVITIPMRLVRATSLDQLRNEHGKARMNMPYWVELGDKGTSETLAPELLFQFVGRHTDPEALNVQINHGLVWIQEKYYSFAKASEDDGNGR